MNLDANCHLRTVLNRYHTLPENSWQAYLGCCKHRRVAKGDILYQVGKVPLSFAFIHEGLMRAYLIDEKGNEYNKNFFSEGRFPGCMTALLTNTPSLLEVEALETCDIIEINFEAFRQLLKADPEIMQFHIHYLEQHWLLEKEQKELNYLQFEAKDRYLDFIALYNAILPRIPQYHIASFLGITPTQLSRIRKEIAHQN